MNINVKTLQRAKNILRKQKGVYSATMRVESGDGSFVWTTGTTNQFAKLSEEFKGLMIVC